jgi:hypothetical protein
MSRRLLVLVPLLLGLVQPLAGTAAAAPAAAPLTNTAHLDFLRAAVTPPTQAGHTTYRIAQEPAVGLLWTYSEPRADGTWTRVGGGPYDAATDTYGQGAYNADDVSRAAVVFLRHWRQTGSVDSRTAAYELLRGLTYLQTSSGPNAGNVVLWAQPDGTLNPSPTPVELPDPSDSGASYWLARSLWALGEGYAAFRTADPAFARFLRDRMELAVGALQRQVLVRYGTYQNVDGVRTPAWLIVDGADASAEAVLGLASYVDAGGSARARTALRQLSEGIARMSTGDAQHYPFGAVRPWALSRSQWHAWASQMPAALARAGVVLHDRALIVPAVKDSATFTPWLLTSDGPDNGIQPTATDRTQIAYGIDSRTQSLLATSAATGSVGFRRLAGLTAAWFFGANRAGVAAYDPATGTTVDGIAPDGTINRNSGAESTIHALLTMLALDAHPDVRAVAESSASLGARVGTTKVEAESGTLAGGSAVVTPESSWTGESQWSGSYVTVPSGGTLALSVPAADQPRLVLPVVNLEYGSRAATVWSSLGTVRTGAVGPQGTSPAPGALLPVTLPRQLPAGATALTATGRGGTTQVDAVLLEPLVSSLTQGSTTLLRSAATTPRVSRVAPSTIEVYDASGRLRARTTGTIALVLPGGFTIARA